jgi:hypothetical protein
VNAPVNIRQATPQDAQLVSDILTEAAQWLEKSGMPMWRADQLDPASVAADVASGLYFLAQNGDDPAGTVRFQLEDPTFWPDALPQEAAYIHRFAIRRQYAGTGASTEVLRWDAATWPPISAFGLSRIAPGFASDVRVVRISSPRRSASRTRLRFPLRIRSNQVVPFARPQPYTMRARARLLRKLLALRADG